MVKKEPSVLCRVSYGFILFIFMHSMCVPNEVNTVGRSRFRRLHYSTWRCTLKMVSRDHFGLYLLLRPNMQLKPNSTVFFFLQSCLQFIKSVGLIIMYRFYSKRFYNGVCLMKNRLKENIFICVLAKQFFQGITTTEFPHEQMYLDIQSPLCLCGDSVICDGNRQHTAFQ